MSHNKYWNQTEHIFFFLKLNREKISTLNYDKTSLMHIVFSYFLPFCLHTLKI